MINRTSTLLVDISVAIKCFHIWDLGRLVFKHIFGFQESRKQLYVTLDAPSSSTVDIELVSHLAPLVWPIRADQILLGRKQLNSKKVDFRKQVEALIRRIGRCVLQCVGHDAWSAYL